MVPSLLAIAVALYETLADPTFYWHLYATFYEIGIAHGDRRPERPRRRHRCSAARSCMRRAYEPLLYYLGPCPKIIFFPVMIMWFGVGPGSKVAMGAISCFFPVALNVAGGMREIDKVLIRVGTELPRQHLADGDQDLSAGDAPPDHQRHAASGSASA